MSAVRDVLAEWLLYLIPWAFIVGAGVTLVFVGRWFGRRDADAEWEAYLTRAVDAHAETVPIPSQRPGSK